MTRSTETSRPEMKFVRVADIRVLPCIAVLSGIMAGGLYFGFPYL
jgi:hypothetical protein